jgi:hypothetical protein
MADGYDAGLHRMSSTQPTTGLIIAAPQANVVVARPRQVHRDGIRFRTLRYIAPTLAAFVGEAVTIRYDPADAGEIRVY